MSQPQRPQLPPPEVSMELASAYKMAAIRSEMTIQSLAEQVNMLKRENESLREQIQELRSKLAPEQSGLFSKSS